MDHVPPRDAAAACSDLSTKAHSTTTNIIQHVIPGVEAGLTAPLTTLATRLQKFRHHVDQLGLIVAAASVMHPQLRSVLDSGLAECQSGLNTVADRSGLASGQALSLDEIALYDSFVVAYSSLFNLETQLLTMGTEQEQETTLASSAAAEIVEAAHNASKRAVSARSGIGA